MCGLREGAPAAHSSSSCGYCEAHWRLAPREFLPNKEGLPAQRGKACPNEASEAGMHVEVYGHDGADSLGAARVVEGDLGTLRRRHKCAPAMPVWTAQSLCASACTVGLDGSLDAAGKLALLALEEFWRQP